MEKIVLISSDNINVCVNKQIATYSSVISDLLQVCDAAQNMPIPLPNVSSIELNKIIEFYEYFTAHPEYNKKYFTTKPKNKDDAIALHKNRMTMNVSDEWTTKFFDITIHEHVKLVSACSYLGTTEMYDVLCALFARKYLNGKTIEQMKENGAFDYMSKPI